MKNILIVEDEKDIRDLIAINLKRGGYNTFEAGTGEDALDIFESNNGKFEVALLDIMLPGIDGNEVCRSIRKLSKSVGIIMLTAKAREADKISGLMQGADDYITKPFSPTELIARVDSLCRRVVVSQRTGNVMDVMKLGEFTLNMRTRTLEKNGELIDLTQVEFQIIEYFFSHPNEALDRWSILAHVWGEGYYGEEKIVDVNIRRLRMKVEDDPSNPTNIVTVWGRGYKWEG